MRAYYYVNGVLDSYTENKFRITEDSMEFDLMLIPYELQELTPGFTPPPEPTNLTNKSNGTGVATASTPWSGLDVGIVAAIIIILLAAVLAYWVLFKPKIKFGNKETEISEKTDEKELDDDCKRVLKILKENEGRMVQKEIRNILNFSETKMSLVTTELEVSGFIRRIKKGRENVLKLVKTS
jgi:uncharacterized membrane protein